MLKKSYLRVRRLIPKRFRRELRETFWPIVRRRDTPELILKTYYPNCEIRITNDTGKWHIDLSNGDPDKITPEEIRSFFGDLLKSRLPESCRLKSGLWIDFRLDSVCLESWRDIHSDRIKSLIDDEYNEFQSEKIGTFGYLMGTTKPERLTFIKYANEHPDKFEYLITDKYSRNMKNYISLLDYKRRYKYVIDLPGHTYSTRSYWLLFLKRPLFYVEPKMKFRWEKRLKPWVHYIPVKRNFSDLLERYQWAQSNPDKVKRMTSNLCDFGIEAMSPTHVIDKFVSDVERCIAKEI